MFFCKCREVFNHSLHTSKQKIPGKKIPLCTSRFFCFTKRMQKEAQRGTYITNIVKLFFEVGPVSQTHVTLFDENLMHTQRRRQAVASLSLGRNLQVIPQ